MKFHRSCQPGTGNRCIIARFVAWNSTAVASMGQVIVALLPGSSLESDRSCQHGTGNRCFLARFCRLNSNAVASMGQVIVALLLGLSAEFHCSCQHGTGNPCLFLFCKLAWLEMPRPPRRRIVVPVPAPGGATAVIESCITIVEQHNQRVIFVITWRITSPRGHISRVRTRVIW